MAFNNYFRPAGSQRHTQSQQEQQNNEQATPRMMCNISVISVDAIYNERGKPDSREVDLSKSLECPVCYSIPEEEVFNCEKGHSVCGNCRLRLDKCAYCAAPFNGSRNFAIESLVSHYKEFGLSLDKDTAPAWKHCRYIWQGCKTLLRCSEINQHESECDYRPVRCKVSNETKCPFDTFLNLSEYFNHLVQRHQIIGLTEPSGFFVKIDRLFMGLDITTNWPPFYLQYDGKTFLRFASLRNRHVSWWIQLIGPDYESRKYRAVISIYNPKKPDTKISWSVPVYSLRTSKAAIEATNIASISSNKILPFCESGEIFDGRVVTHSWCCNVAINQVVC